jgi:Zinc finger, C2H2 type
LTNIENFTALFDEPVVEPVVEPEMLFLDEKAVPAEGWPKSGRGRRAGPRCYRYAKNYSNEPRPFKCEEPSCIAAFTAERFLRFHKNTTHRKKPDYCCDLCGKTYIRRSLIELHMAYHTEPKLPCPECGKMFHHRYTLYTHLKKIHKDLVSGYDILFNGQNSF